MTISSSSNKAQFNGSGTTGPFPFTFKVFAQGDLDVIKADAVGVETTLTLTTNYTVSLNGDQNNNPGGSVTTVAVVASGHKLTVVRVVDALQETDITNGGGFYPEVIENSLDRVTMLVQQVGEIASRAVTVPISSALTPTNYLTTLDTYQTNAAASAAAASASQTAAGNSASAAATSAANLPNSATAGGNKILTTNSGGTGWDYDAIPTGIVLGNGSALSAAAAGTDYLAPAAIGVTVQGYDVDTAKLDVDQSWTGAQRGAISALTDAATIALDLGLSNNFLVQLGGNRILGEPTNIVACQSGSITVLQDKTGSRTLSYSWPYVWAGGTAGTLSTAGASEDQLVYEVRSYNQATATITIATPGVVTMAAHGFHHGQRVQLTTTGALPTGLTASTTYFVEVIGANSFYLCTTRANVAAGTRIATSGSQSGVHTLTGATIRLALNKAFA